MKSSQPLARARCIARADARLGRDVAIKVLPPHVADDPSLKERFEREARALGALSHPHICPVFDVGAQDGIDFLVMEFLDGETLAVRLTKGRCRSIWRFATGPRLPTRSTRRIARASSTAI